MSKDIDPVSVLLHALDNKFSADRNTFSSSIYNSSGTPGWTRIIIGTCFGNESKTTFKLLTKYAVSTFLMVPSSRYEFADFNVVAPPPVVDDDDGVAVFDVVEEECFFIMDDFLLGCVES